MFAFTDGSVRFLNENTSLKNLANYVTRAGGEVIAPDYILSVTKTHLVSFCLLFWQLVQLHTQP